ncbi:hypothetical protein [Kribbella sp. NPDC050459]|uniref:hypothetical protein n=1 Tax=Kribbella sp. NPDC050459 TaxID=3155785 RepID=UPI0033E41633
MPPRNPASAGTVVLLTAALALLMVGVFALAGRLVHQSEPAAAPEVAPSVVPSVTSSVTPWRNPRFEPDVDRGMPIGHGVFVEVPGSWTARAYTNVLDATSWDRGAYVGFNVAIHPMPSLPLLLTDAQGYAEVQAIHGFRAGRARVLPPPNRNIAEAGSISFTGRRTEGGATYSLAGECVRLRGAPRTNDISISICWAAYVQDLGTVRPEVEQMIASAARSI